MILRKSDRGDAVTGLQERLVGAGYSLTIDGHFGDKTMDALRRFQGSHGLIADGIAGPNTFRALERALDPRGIKESDYKAASEKLGVSVAVIKAITDVESREDGFIGDNPIILYERHIMYRQLESRGLDARALAKEYPNLVNQQRGGYLGGSHEWGRLMRACTLHREAALESASYGLFQVMGFNWSMLKYEDVDDFVTAMERSEADHLDAFVRYIEATDLTKYLKAIDGESDESAPMWAAARRFARGYNGPGYASNDYDTKIVRAVLRRRYA